MTDNTTNTDGWTEVRRSVPVEYVECVPEDSFEYEVWVCHQDGVLEDSLTIYKQEDEETYWLVRHYEDEEEHLVDEFASYEYAKAELERCKEEYDD